MAHEYRSNGLIPDYSRLQSPKTSTFTVQITSKDSKLYDKLIIANENTYIKIKMRIYLRRIPDLER